MTLSRRARQLRQQQGLTLRGLAERSGLSLRFLMDVEAGRGNISVRRLADLAAALQTTPADLVTAHREDPAPRVIALLGLRGAGKTTVGRRLARRLRAAASSSSTSRSKHAPACALGEIFSLHGEDFYRRLERDTLADLLERAPVDGPRRRRRTRHRAGDATPCSCGTTTTVWLKARADDYWTRVIRQGDRRPIEQHPQAREALRQLVARREPLYARAHVTRRHCRAV